MNTDFIGASKSIIDFCKANRVSTTEVADALGKKGVLRGVKPLNEQHYVVGNVFPVFTAFGSNYEVHEQIREVQSGDVVLIFAHECEDLAIIGEVVAKYLLLYKGAGAVVVSGMVRDVSRLRRDNYPIWCEDFTPLGCNNLKQDRQFPEALEREMRSRFEGGIAICDDGGVTVIERNLVNEETLTALHKIEIQEDIWAFCLNTLKWDTKKIVCDRAYLNEPQLFSSAQVEALRFLKEG
jgi:4-hydroxy-4-methyl-2-oxoglutarate aldolase